METFIIVDVEADGPIPGPYSMLSLGAAACDSSGKLLDTFEANFKTLPGAKTHPVVMEWWSKWPQAWKRCRQNP